MYFPELAIAADTVRTSDESTTLYGIIDLLIVDKKGRVHILDYKTSIHTYDSFSPVKKRAYSY